MKRHLELVHVGEKVYVVLIRERRACTDYVVLGTGILVSMAGAESVLDVIDDARWSIKHCRRLLRSKYAKATQEAFFELVREAES